MVHSDFFTSRLLFFCLCIRMLSCVTFVMPGYSPNFEGLISTKWYIGYFWGWNAVKLKCRKSLLLPTPLLLNAIDLEEILRWTKSDKNQTVNDGVAHAKNPKKCAYHVTFDLGLDLENTLDACLPGDHRVQVWWRSGHLSARRSDLRKSLQADRDRQTDRQTDGQTTDAALLH